MALLQICNATKMLSHYRAADSRRPATPPLVLTNSIILWTLWPLSPPFGSSYRRLPDGLTVPSHESNHYRDRASHQAEIRTKTSTLFACICLRHTPYAVGRCDPWWAAPSSFGQTLAVTGHVPFSKNLSCQGYV